MTTEQSPRAGADTRAPAAQPPATAGLARERLLGIALVVFSACCFGFVDGFSKLLSNEASVAQIVWARYALALPILLVTTTPAKLPALFKTRRRALQILRGLTPIVISVTMVLAVRYLPLSEATVILFAAPFLVVLLAVPVLGERVTASRLIAVTVGFAAVLVVARPGFSEVSRYAVFPLIAALFYAALQLITRRVAASGERAVTTLAWTLLTGIVVVTPFAWLTWQPLDGRGWALMIGLGTIFGIAQLTMIRGFAHAPAALLAPLAYVQIASAVLFSMVVFHETPDAWTLLGIAMIAGSGIYVVRQRTD
jgi:drug/metabolite transporter (DMT)-like permease